MRFRQSIAIALLTVPALAGVALAETEAATAPAAEAVEAVDPTLSAAEREALVALYEQSRSELEALTARATGDAWSQRPAEDSWSVGEVVEHLVLAEEALFGMVQGALAAAPDPQWRDYLGHMDQVVSQLQDRSQKFTAPPNLEPTGEGTRVELLERYAAVRAVTLDFVHGTAAPLKEHTATGPPGTMNVHQWLTLIAAHNLRHNRQIADALEAIGG